MTRFSVEPGELQALGRTLAGVHGRLVHVTGMMSSLGGSATGHHGLALALEGFAEEWAFSLGKIKEHAEAMRGMVVQAADTYRAVDDEISSATRG
jgi:hypothetical protein